MAAFTVKSAGLTTTGTTGADLFTVSSAAIAKSTILGLAGADTIDMAAGVSTATSLLVDVAGDKDVVTVSGGVLSASTLKGGAGADSLVVTLTAFNASNLNGGDGNDTITFSGGGAFSASTLTLGGGIDDLVFSATNFTKSTIAAGSGADTVDVGFGVGSSSTVFGGGGADSITVSANGGGGLLINGDSTINGGGADTITFEGTLSSSTINAKGGKDIVTIETGGVVGTASSVLGNAGADVIAISGAIGGSANLIGGGSGNDTITLSGTLGSNNTLQGGGGKDQLNFEGVSISAQIFGGAGADTITIISEETTFNGQISYASFSESNLSNLDEVNGFNDGGSGSLFTVSAVTTTLQTGSVAGAGFTAAQTDGYITDADFSTAGNLTARAALVDASVTTKGDTVVFEAGDVNYLFIQGGSTGNTYDLIVNVGTGVAVGLTFASASVELS